MNIAKITFTFIGLLAVFFVAAQLSACEKGQQAERDKTFEEWHAETEKLKQKPMPKCREAQAGGPEEVVRTLYSQYPVNGKRIVAYEPKAVLSGYFDERTSRLIARWQACGPCTGGGIDILYDSSVADISDFHICAMDLPRNTVRVLFRDIGEPRIATYKLVKTSAGWRISDIVYSDHSGTQTMVGVFSQMLADGGG